MQNGHASIEPLILAVDDCEDDRSLMASILKIIGCQCITTFDGTTALELAQQCQPDLILLDIWMPSMDGLEVVHFLKQNVETASIPVVAVTGVVMLSLREQFLAAGGDDYLAKPYTIAELDRSIRHNLSLQPKHAIP